MKKIYFIAPYPFNEAPSQRFRYEQYLDVLNKKGYEYYISPFLGIDAWNRLYKPGNYFQKALNIVQGFARRSRDIFSMSGYDFVFIHREAAPIGPPVFEWFISKVLRKKIIYDFDDAIWLPNTSDHNQVISGIKWHSKVARICSWSYKISCGNEYLADYARQFNKNVVINPSTIDTVNYHNRIKDQHTPTVTIGWTGTHSTIQYLDMIVPILQKLEQQYDFTFIVISNEPPSFELKSLKYIRWSKDKEIDDLLTFNVGVMPLTDDAWARGKCGFKALQYMSLGIPALVSPVGVNTIIVDDGVNGMICHNPDEWEQAIKKLITDRGLNISLGKEARKKIGDNYSVISNSENFAGLFQS
jgi:glycosyltransferase involved in cell wall biosynthesis